MPRNLHEAPVTTDPHGQTCTAMTSGACGLTVYQVVPPGGDLDDALATAIEQHEHERT